MLSARFFLWLQDTVDHGGKYSFEGFSETYYDLNKEEIKYAYFFKTNVS